MVPTFINNIELVRDPALIAAKRPPGFWGGKLAKWWLGEDYEQAKLAVSLNLEAMPVPDMTSCIQDESLWSNPWVRDSVFRRIGSFVFNVTTEDRPLNDEECALIGTVYPKYGLTTQEGANIFESLLSYNSHQDTTKIPALRQAYIFRNLRRMDAMDQKNPYAVAALYQQFGIRHFARYNSQLLLPQLRGKFSRAPKVALLGASDWAGSFNRFSADIPIHEILSTNHPIITEAGSTAEAAKRLIAIAAQYGPIKSLFVGAHGGSDLLQFSEGAHGELTKRQVEQSSGFARLIEKGIFDPEIHIILLVCEAGKDGGLAACLATKTGAKVTAIDQLTFNISRRGLKRRLEFTCLNEDGKQRNMPGLTYTSTGSQE